MKGMLFKFGQDVQIGENEWIYGGTEQSNANAQKSVGHELKALSALYSVIKTNKELSKLRIPLMTVVDYCGFRLSVQSLLPICLFPKFVLYFFLKNFGGKITKSVDIDRVWKLKWRSNDLQ